MADEFVCSVCGKAHGGLPTDWGYTLPDDVWEIPEPERSDVAKFTSDLCQMGDRCFIRCVLEVPFTDDDGYFDWGVWVEVDWAVFERYWEMYDEDGRSEPVHSAILANALAPYPGIKGTPVLLQFREPSKRPSLHFPAEDCSELAAEQRRGIDEQRHHEILESLER